MVVVWLLYRWPKQTQHHLAIGVFIVLGLLAFLLVAIFLSSVQSDLRWQAEQAELAKVVVQASYDAGKCTTEKPLLVFIGNTSSKTVKAISWDLEAYVPGHSTNLVDYATSYKSDVILKPNQSVSYCYPLPKLNANVDPTSLEFKIARPDILFAQEQPN